MRTAYFIPKQGLAINKYPSLCELQKSNNVVLGTNYFNREACVRFLKSISCDLITEDYKHFSDSRFASVLCDGSTDKGILEQEAVYVRYMKENEPVTRFIGITNPDTVDAAGIFNAINSVLTSNLIDEKQGETLDNNVYKKLINANFDGASVMSGDVSGVQARLKKKQPGLLYTHCVAHKLELAVLDAIKCDAKYLQVFDDNINALFRYYYYSTVRRKELQKVADFLETEFKQLGRLKNIRWLASRSRALTILEKDFKIIIFDLESKTYSSNDVTAAKARGFLKFLKNPKFLFFVHFLQDLVAILRDLSFSFQRDSLIACEIPRLVEETCVKVDALSITPGESVERIMKNLTTEEDNLVYEEVTLSKPDGRRADPLPSDKNSYLEFYKVSFDKMVEKTQDYIKLRFGTFEKSPLKEMATLYDFKLWPHSFKDEKRWGLNEVKTLSDYYFDNDFITSSERDSALRQWPLFRERVLKRKSEGLYATYVSLLAEHHADIKSVNILLQIMLTISCSTAVVERGFSAMNSQKTSLRTLLSKGTLNSIMKIAVDGPSVEEFDAPKHVENWIANSSGFRHLEGHRAPKRKHDEEPMTLD